MYHKLHKVITEFIALLDRVFLFHPEQMRLLRQMQRCVSKTKTLNSRVTRISVRHLNIYSE